MNPIQYVIELAGGPVALTRELNKCISRPITYQAVLKWARQGRLPRTEWTGETQYAKAMSSVVGGKVKVRELLVRPGAVKAGVPGVTESEQKQALALSGQAHAATETVAQGVAHGH